MSGRRAGGSGSHVAAAESALRRVAPTPPDAAIRWRGPTQVFGARREDEEPGDDPRAPAARPRSRRLALALALLIAALGAGAGLAWAEPDRVNRAVGAIDRAIRAR